MFSSLQCLLCQHHTINILIKISCYRLEPCFFDVLVELLFVLFVYVCQECYLALGLAVYCGCCYQDAETCVEGQLLIGWFGQTRQVVQFAKTSR